MHPVAEGLTTAELVDDPYPLYDRLRVDAPVCPVAGGEACLVTTWSLVAEAAARTEDFSNHFRRGFFTRDDGTLGVLDTGSTSPDVFAGADPPDHAVHRKLFVSELVQQRMAALEPTVAGLADAHLDALLVATGGAGDFVRLVADPLPVEVVTRHVIGFRDVDVDQVHHWVASGSRLTGGRLRLAEMGAMAGEIGGMAPWVAAQLEAARARTDVPDDVLGAAVTGVREGVLSAEAAAFTLMVFVGAGGETTSGLLGNAVRSLAERPALQDALRAEPARIPAFVEEILRLESPFWFHPRMAARDTELGGVAIPEGTLVALMWGAANRDGAVFANPAKLDIDRPNNRLHFGFGRGIHHCVGAPLARLEARVVLERLLARTRCFSLDPADPPLMADNLWVHRHDRLPILPELV